MKSIGNGWKSAQRAKNRAWLNKAQTSYDLQQEAYMRDQAIRAMSPEAMQAKAEREAPLMQNADAAEYIHTGDGKTKPKNQPGSIFDDYNTPNIWQRIKRALC
jgi:hypothetical protein